MNGQAELLLAKAQKVVLTAQGLIRDGHANDAGRGAHLATYHAVQAYILDHTGRISAQLAALEPTIDGQTRKFLQDAHELKSSVDDDVGEDADISPADAAAAVEAAARFVNYIAVLLEGSRAR